MGLNEIAARLAEPARWIIIGGIAFTLANLVLFFVSPPGGSEATSEAGARPATSTPVKRPPVSLNAILSRNLFGEAGATAAPTDTSLPVVETRLPLELLSVAVNEVDAEQSTAIVAQKGRPGELYTVGEVLPGNAELIEVHADHIVLRRAGSRETLRFPTVSSVPVAPPPISASVSQPDLEQADQAQWTEDVPSPRDFVAEYRDQLDADPQSALQTLGLTPVDEGSASGYRLDDAVANSPYLSQTGLQPGDVVLSVNGQPVGDIQQDRLQLDNILAQGSARIEVQRGTRRFFVTASLNR